MNSQSLILALVVFTSNLALAGGLPTAKKAAEMANGRVGAGKQFQVIRLEGTNVELGKKIISGSGLNVIPADDLDDAAQKIVKAVREAK